MKSFLFLMIIMLITACGTKQEKSVAELQAEQAAEDSLRYIKEQELKSREYDSLRVIRFEKLGEPDIETISLEAYRYIY